MKYEEYITEDEARDPEFRAERERLQPQYEFRKALIGARLATGLTQKQLAERLGTKQSAIARLESGTMLPSVETLYRLSSELGVKIEIAPKGNRILAGQDREEVGLVPAGLEALGLDPGLRRGVLVEEVEGDVAQDGEVLGGVAGPDAALVLAEGDVEHPVEAVLDAPVVADGAGEGVGVPGEAAEVVMELARDCGAAAALALDQADAGQVGPGASRVEVGEDLRVGDGPVLADLDAPVAAVDGPLVRRSAGGRAGSSGSRSPAPRRSRSPPRRGRCPDCP